MDDMQAAAPQADRNRLLDQIPVEVTVSVGKARPIIADLLNLTSSDILPLDRRIDDQVELYIGDKLIARGELQEMEGDDSGRLAVRLTEIVSDARALS
ncbi:FliM/FliN family flagellar motor switch protein [Salipiger sp. IMCC34102]|uniref:FliM/FliN family flagellar motor switch protein n=1 Tax=Salipiger sp. IMCC34102 TaxID=2510647 RepID=UPI00101D0603|nr:FliM/FliN family flagellar motor C-terminal domain-containing protein [Salipiger sp. IMCC34102]RYH01555.1 FliM/FliN family flagellar motor switch protein [Salipiger sp. IMCC34102]